MSSRIVLGLALAFSLRAGADPKAATPRRVACAANPRIVGPCFSVRGELMSGNGNPAFRIYHTKTGHVLGVVETPLEQPMMPADLLEKAADPHAVVADFRVCPLTKERPGSMWMVCIESADNVRSSR